MKLQDLGEVSVDEAACPVHLSEGLNRDPRKQEAELLLRDTKRRLWNVPDLTRPKPRRPTQTQTHLSLARFVSSQLRYSSLLPNHSSSSLPSVSPLSSQPVCHGVCVLLLSFFATHHPTSFANLRLLPLFSPHLNYRVLSIRPKNTTFQRPHTPPSRYLIPPQG